MERRAKKLITAEGDDPSTPCSSSVLDTALLQQISAISTKNSCDLTLDVYGAQGPEMLDILGETQYDIHDKMRALCVP